MMHRNRQRSTQETRSNLVNRVLRSIHMSHTDTTSGIDPFEVRKLYKYLRVVDVADAMDGIGYFNIGLVDTDIRPLWNGIKFWGVALTIRCVPANRPMWKLTTTEEIVGAHGLWFAEVPHQRINHLIR